MAHQMIRELIRERREQGVDREAILAELKGLGLTAEQLAQIDAELQGKESPEAAVNRHLEYSPLYMTGVALFVSVTALALYSVLGREAVVATLYVASIATGVFGMAFASLWQDWDDAQLVRRWDGRGRWRWHYPISVFTNPVRNWKVLLLLATSVGLLILASSLGADLVSKWMPKSNRNRRRPTFWHETRPAVVITPNLALSQPLLTGNSSQPTTASAPVAPRPQSRGRPSPAC